MDLVAINLPVMRLVKRDACYVNRDLGSTKTLTQYVSRITLQSGTSCSGRKRFRQTNRPRVQRLPDDHALDAVGGVRRQSTDVGQAADAAAGDNPETARRATAGVVPR